MRVVIIILVLALIGLQYKFWFGDGGLNQLANLEKKITTQDDENAKLKARNLALDADIAELKSGDQALEEQARYELGMVKQDEVYYQFLD